MSSTLGGNFNPEGFAAFSAESQAEADEINQTLYDRAWWTPDAPPKRASPLLTVRRSK